MSSKESSSGKRQGYLQGRWTPSQCERFLKGYQICGKNWVEVQKYVKTRSLSQVRSHAQKIFLKRQSHGLDPQSSNQNSSQISYKESSQDQQQLVPSSSAKKIPQKTNVLQYFGGFDFQMLPNFFYGVDTATDPGCSSIPSVVPSESSTALSPLLKKQNQLEEKQQRDTGNLICTRKQFQQKKKNMVNLPSRKNVQKYMTLHSKNSYFMEIVIMFWEHFQKGGDFLQMAQRDKQMY